MAYITYEDFYTNFLPKDGERGTQIVLERSPLQLKKESDELKTIIDIMNGINPLEFSTLTTYKESDYVYHNGSIYRSSADDNLNNTPPNATFWSVINLEPVAKDSLKVSKSGDTMTGTLDFNSTFNVSSNTNTLLESSNNLQLKTTATNDITIDSSNSVEIKSVNNTCFSAVTANGHSNAILHYDGLEKLSTSSAGITVTGSATINGDAFISGTLTESSDKRLKENIVDVNDSLNKVLQLNGVKYNKIGSIEKEIGFIAQDVQAIQPELVQEDENGMLSVSYARTVALLVEAIKTQQRQIEELKTKLTEV